jgi:hypothetical protein
MNPKNARIPEYSTDLVTVLQIDIKKNETTLLEICDLQGRN